ncbi:hypothetical protein LLR47_17150 [Bacillus cereus]|uniref:hypothetical protein n=1 Tax=Bacillus cereus TaxID=1396 RepID=UPI001D13566B|nr:hypothetical protein [Bacillus cereus]MCC3686956.1 hypothetical protein [Bacillus cereus]
MNYDKIQALPLTERFSNENDMYIYPFLICVEVDKYHYEEHEILYLVQNGVYCEFIGLGKLPYIKPQTIAKLVKSELKREIKTKGMLIPISEWYCDDCGQVIFKEDDAIIECKTHNIEMTKNTRYFRIIHKKCISQIGVRGEIVAFNLGFSETLNNLLISVNDKIEYDLDSFNEVLKRTTVPYYEQARRISNANDTIQFNIQDLNRNRLRNYILEYLNFGRGGKLI